MKVWVIIVIVIIVILVIAAGWFYFGSKPDIKAFEHLKNPAISQLPVQNMLVVESVGDPNVAGIPAIKLLFKTYFSMKGVPKGPKQAAPRARWPLADFATPKNEWVGLFAMPVPETITTLPTVKNPDSLKVYLTVWEYGTVAEILHEGSYATEQPTIKRLTDYITQQGYKIIGDHEEEYIKGPGMFGPGNPDKYLTIIRYRVEKLMNAEDKDKAQKQK